MKGRHAVKKNTKIVEVGLLASCGEGVTQRIPENFGKNMSSHSIQSYLGL